MTITGVYMPQPYVGFQAMKAGLTQETYLEAYRIHKDKQNFKDQILSDEMTEKVFDIKNSTESEY